MNLEIIFVTIYINNTLTIAGDPQIYASMEIQCVLKPRKLLPMNINEFTVQFNLL